MTDKTKWAPNFSLTEKTLLLNIINNFKHIIENKQTNSQTWRDKAEAWKRISNIFNSQSDFPRTSEALKKYYDNIKKIIRKEVADEKKEITKTRGGKAVSKDNPVKEFALGIMNEKTVYRLKNLYDCDAQHLLVSELVSNEDIELEDNENVLLDQLSFIDKDCVQGGSKQIEESVDHNYACKNTILETPTKYQPAYGVGSRKHSNSCLKETWTKRRRPAIQQLPSSKLSEEYMVLAKVKRECFEAEKQNILRRNEREEELFELQKKKLLLDIKLRELQIKNAEQLD